jgi:hypothetical protein
MLQLLRLTSSPKRVAISPKVSLREDAENHGVGHRGPDENLRTSRARETAGRVEELIWQRGCAGCGGGGSLTRQGHRSREREFAPDLIQKAYIRP